MDPAKLDHLMGSVWLAVAAAAGIGVVTMAIVQLLKDLFPLRGDWQRRWIKDVVRQQAATAQTSAETVLRDLINLATAGNEWALYNLPIEQLCGQLNSAAQVVLDFPARHKELFRVLAAGADASDLDKLLTERPQARAVAATRDAGVTVSSEQIQVQVDFVDARNRVAHQVQRNLDALQIAMSVRWKLYLQMASLVVGLVCSVVIVRSLAGPPDDAAWYGVVIVIGLLGGFLATVIRDLDAVVQNLRGKR